MKRLQQIKFESYYLFLALFFGIAFVFITPPNATPDEIAHQVKIVRIAQGNFFGADKQLALPDIANWYGPLGNSKMLTPPYNITGDEIKEVISKQIVCAKETTKSNDGITSYSPLPYVLSAINYKVSCSLKVSFGTYLYSSRIVALLWAILIVFAAMKIAPNLKFAFFTIAMLPAVLYQFSAIAADSFLISLTMLYCSYISRHLNHKNKKDIIMIFIIGMALCFSKPSYAWIIFLTLPVILSKEGKLKSTTYISRVFFLILLPVLLHLVLLVASKGSAPHVVHVEENIEYLKQNPLSLLSEIYYTPSFFPFGTQWNLYESLIGKLGWLTIPLPKWCYYMAAINFLILLFIGRRASYSTSSNFMILVSIFSIIPVCLPLYLYATNQPYPAVFGLQGRYFIPSVIILFTGLTAIFQTRYENHLHNFLVLSVLSISFSALLAVFKGFY
ncbi:DUF2142 domain-containing protein [Pantoea sp.]|uniref:DUF2142 domain-containing protein n=1 Tax=Pantoea sp. TaxID=69393 RepID=UPI00289AD4C5|nr:DUF2142 domain-containing protein [Pantoea sp.]